MRVSIQAGKNVFYSEDIVRHEHIKEVARISQKYGNRQVQSEEILDFLVAMENIIKLVFPEITEKDINRIEASEFSEILKTIGKWTNGDNTEKKT